MKKLLTLILLFSTAVSAQNTGGIFCNSSVLKQYDSSYLKNEIITGLNIFNSLEFTSANRPFAYSGNSYIITNSKEHPGTFVLNPVNDDTSETFTKGSVLGAFLNSRRPFIPSDLYTSATDLPRVYTVGTDQVLSSEFPTFPGLRLPPSTSLNAKSVLSAIAISSIASETYILPTNYSGFTDRSEAVYKNKNEIVSFEFHDHELLNDEGVSLSLLKTVVSSAMSPQFSAGPGNGAYIIHQAIYKESWVGSDTSEWARLSAPSSSEGVSFALFSSANVAGNNTNGAFVINTVGNNSFSMRIVGATGIIGWDNAMGTMNLNASLIETNADIIQNGIFKSNTSIAVSNSGDLSKLSINENIQGYFSSSHYGTTGVVIENLNADPNSSAGITIRQQGANSWIGTISETSNSKLYLPGSFVLKSKGDIVLSTSSAINGNYGQLRIAVNNKEVARFTGVSLLIGTLLDVSSSALTIESDSRGVLLPRLTTEQIRNISYPEEGVIMYNKTRKKFWFYNGEQYEEVCSKVITDL